MSVEAMRPLGGEELAQSVSSAGEPRRDWWRRNWVDLVILVGLVMVIGFVHLSGMNAYPARFDDEGAYMSQAWAVLKHFDLAPYTYWYDHPPLGWIILAVYTLFTGALDRAPYGVAAGREAVFVLQMVSVVLLYLLARRLGMNPLFAAVTVMLFGLSPLAVFYHRMVLLDNVGMPLLLGGFVLLLSPRKRLGAHVFAALCFALAILVRETFVLVLPAAAYLYWKRTDPRLRRYSLALTLTTFGGTVALYPIFALLRGELLPSPDRVSLLGSIAWQLTGRQASGSIFDPSGPAGHVVAGWLSLDPWTLSAGLVTGIAAFFVTRLRWVGITVAILALLLVRPGYLPVMYIVAALPFLALAVGGVLDEAWKRLTSRATGRSGWGLMVGRSVAVVGLLVALTGAWYALTPGVAHAMNTDADRPFRQAQEWLDAHLTDGDVVALDGALWLDVVRSGHPVDKTIWYYKLDTDPAVKLPGDWRGVDYVVTTEVIRTTNYRLPNVDSAIQHSAPVEVFGEGDGRVEIRKVDSS